jgi:hypothetical protein
MPSPPHNVWHILPHLSWLSLAHNPVTALKNESFLSLDRLRHLDISGMDLGSLEASLIFLLRRQCYFYSTLGYVIYIYGIYRIYFYVTYFYKAKNLNY